jgi:FMN phosphatase YigB (HAD superfamily)
LADDEVEQLVRLTYDSMAADYENPARHDDFPQVADTLRNCSPALANVELNRIEEVIAIHELGRIPDAYAAHLRQLGQTHRLGLVANIWSRKALWLRELERAGVLDLLEYPVFSSDCRSMKPSPVLFNLAFEPFGVRREEVVFIGDSLVNDIAGARRAGFATVWINPAGSPSDQPDWTVPSLLDCCSFGRGS